MYLITLVFNDMRLAYQSRRHLSAMIGSATSFRFASRRNKMSGLHSTYMRAYVSAITASELQQKTEYTECAATSSCFDFRL